MSYTGGDPRWGRSSLAAFDIQAIRALYGNPSQDGRQVANMELEPSPSKPCRRSARARRTSIHGVAVKDVIKGDAGNDRIHGFGGDDICMEAQAVTC